MKARRRAVVVTALVATVMVLPVSAAHAATSAVSSPEAGAVFMDTTEPVAIRATVQRGLFEARPSTVTARLVAQDGTPIAGSQSVELTMIGESCGVVNCTSTWEVRSGDNPVLFNPATLQPFASMPSCNGGYGIQVALGGSDSWSGNGFTISRAPGSPTPVKVATKVGQATVSWQPPSQPDVTGYTIEQRRSGSGSWNEVATVGPSTTSFTQKNLAPGTIEYRVRAWRGNGQNEEGQTLAPCADTELNLASAWSSTASGTVPSSSTSPSPGDGSTEPGDDETEPTDESTEPTDESTEPTDESTEPTDESTDPEPEASPSPTARPRTATRAAPPRVESEERRDVEAPEISQPERRERFFGDDEEYSEELDFGAFDPGDTDREPGTVTIQVPGGLQSVLGEQLDLERALAPVAGGMILLSLGLHLWQWTRRGLV
jgi:hypothetical protein